MKIHVPVLLLLAASLAGCAAPEPVEKPWPQPDAFCASDTVLLDAHFETGNLGTCTVTGDGRFTLALFPEKAPPINPSAWFAFRASGTPGTRIDIRLELDHGYARYWPKLSADGEHWTALAPEVVTGGGEASKTMTFSFELEGAQAWIAGQEILDNYDYRDWMNELAAVEGVENRFLGRSVQGRPILLAETPDRPEFVLFIGRQHPPEVTGALGMKAFLDTVFADTDLAREFRDRYKVGVAPLLNPDGVADGHWRLNANGIDLNRDWGPFTQPETRAVMDWVEKQEAAGRKLVLMLDFHSTWEDLFYTPAIQDPPGYATNWLNAVRERLPDFPFRHVPTSDYKQPNSKNYFFTSRGIPALTYEVGDDTDREAIRTAAEMFAEEMMRLLLER